jgi:hypothetical protein
VFVLRESPCGRGCLRNMGVEGGRETNPIFVFLFFLLLGFPRRLPFFMEQQETNSQSKQPILKTKNIRYAFSTLATSHSMRLFREIHDVSYKICRRCSLLSFFLAQPHSHINRTRFVELVPALVLFAHVHFTSLIKSSGGSDRFASVIRISR